MTDRPQADESENPRRQAQPEDSPLRRFAPLLWIVAVLVTVGALLSYGGVAARRPEALLSAEQVASGLEQLADLPAIAYRGTQSELLGDSRELDAEVQWRVSADGLALGSVSPADAGADCTVAQVPEGVFAEIEGACEDYYRDGLYRGSGERWTLFGERLWFAPGLYLTPAVYAEALDREIELSMLVDGNEIERRDLNGVASLALSVGGGTVYFAEDGAILLIEGVAVTTLAGTGFGITGTVDPAEMGSDQIRRFGEDLAATAAAWSEVMFFGGYDMEETVEREEAACEGAVCVVESDIAYADKGTGIGGLSLVIAFTGEITTDRSGVGPSTCSQIQEVEFDATAHFECTVDLHAVLGGDLGYSYWWESSTAVAYPMLHQDPASIADGVQGQIDQLLAGIG